MKKIIRVLAAVAAGLVLAGPGTLATPAAAQAAPAGESTRLELPRPTGAFAVGRDTLHLVDREHKDPWVPTADRELLLSLYYPALAHTGSPAPYMAVAEAKACSPTAGSSVTTSPPSAWRPPAPTPGPARCPGRRPTATR
ncbi:hypothetical protein [Streptomyces virginiae]|uniref:hypothetical protein n=1 Tax=Streptomyces virginiae TaxID=1961 RepID=UPI00406381C1